MKVLLFIILILLFFVAYAMYNVKKMVERGHNDRFEPREESEMSKIYNKSKVDKSKAEDVNFEEIK